MAGISLEWLVREEAKLPHFGTFSPFLQNDKRVTQELYDTFSMQSLKFHKMSLYEFASKFPYNVVTAARLSKLASDPFCEGETERKLLLWGFRLMLVNAFQVAFSNPNFPLRSFVYSFCTALAAVAKHFNLLSPIDLD